MKHIYKIIFITIFAIICIPSYAGIQMCSANDTVAVVLDASEAPLNSNIYSAIKAWKANFSYGTIQGQYACVANDSGYYNKVYDVLPNSVVNSGGGVGCIKISHPAMSRWFCTAYDSNCTNGGWVSSKLNTTWNGRYSLFSSFN